MNYSISQVAWVLDLTTHQVRRYIAAGLLDAYPRLGDMRVTRTDLICFCIAFGYSMRRLGVS